MYVRLEFEEYLDTDIKKSTYYNLSGFPNGTCLSSGNFRYLTTKALHAINWKVFFWYIDEDVLIKQYGDIESALDEVRRMPGVKSLIILPQEEDIESKLEKYI